MKVKALGLVFLTAALVAPLAAQDAGAPQGTDTSANYWPPWVTRTTSSKATVNWHGETDGLGSVEYAMSSYYDTHQKFQNTVTCQTKSGYQHVELVDLRPNTVYVYRVKPSGKNDAYDIRSFRTMPVKGKFVFIVISDTQEGHDYTEAMRFKLVADAIAKETEAVFVLHGGDNAGHDSPALWLKYFEAADAMLARTAIYPTIGNHEYHNDGGVHPPATAEQYRWSYDVPEHYSFECAGIRFIVLDTPDPATAETDDPHTSPALAQSQVEWLKKELDNHMSGTFTIHHHPIWDQDRITTNSDLQPWEDLYHAFGISATFAGHTHDYQRYSIGGIPYFVVGNAGGRFADITDDTQFAAGYVIAKTRNLGYLRVTVDPANNTATADEIFVASVQEDDSDETPVVFDPPHIADTVTFPLSVAPGKVQHPAAFQVQLVNQP